MTRSKKKPTALRPNRGRKRTNSRRGPERDPAYLAWIRQQRCTVALNSAVGDFFCSNAIEAAHTGERGLQQKASDHAAIPLCAGHHRLRPDSHHRIGKKFFEHHEIDLIDTIFSLRAEYLRMNP